MSQKKDKRPKAAQQLIDSLLDENTSAGAAALDNQTAAIAFDKTNAGDHTFGGGSDDPFDLSIDIDEPASPNAKSNSPQNPGQNSAQNSSQNSSQSSSQNSSSSNDNTLVLPNADDDDLPELSLDEPPTPPKKSSGKGAPEPTIRLPFEDTMSGFNQTRSHLTLVPKPEVPQPDVIEIEPFDEVEIAQPAKPAAPKPTQKDDALAKAAAKPIAKTAATPATPTTAKAKVEPPEPKAAAVDPKPHQKAPPESQPEPPKPKASFTMGAAKKPQATAAATRQSEIDPDGLTDVRSASRPTPGGRPAGSPAGAAPSRAISPGGAFSSAEATLKQSENLRIAQSRISELEREVERLRRENEMLATAGETMRRRADELMSKAENLEVQSKDNARTHEEEKKLLRAQVVAKDRENQDYRGKLDEMESRLESNFKKIRVRERELEHRLEIVKMESATLVSTKDKMILELKRQIDQLQSEQEYAQAKTQELFNQFKEKQETHRRVVRALRIALTILEGDDQDSNGNGE